MCPIPLLFLILTPAADPTWKIVPPSKDFPPLDSIVLTDAGASGPTARGHRALATITKYETTLRLPSEGPFDLWWVGKEGLPLRVLAKTKSGDLTGGELRIGDRLGIVRLRGDNLPRVESIIIAPFGDPGPSENGHQMIQMATEYKVEMVVPEGEYSLWIVPKNVARGQRVESKVRVYAGKVTNVD